jgi:hypothetical protein
LLFFAKILFTVGVATVIIVSGTVVAIVDINIAVSILNAIVSSGDASVVVAVTAVVKTTS